MRAWLPSWVLGLAACAALPALAQQMQLEPSAAAGCLVSINQAQPLPVYPMLQEKAALPGRVLVEFDFKGPSRAPSVQVLERTGDVDFAAAVESHAKNLRLPCLAPLASARLRQEFVFHPDDRQVYDAEPADPPDPKRASMMKCIVNASGGGTPPYPTDALRRNIQGNVLARLRYDAADQPPQVELFHREATELLARGVRNWAEGFRMPCHEGEPVTVSIIFVFRFHQEPYGFKPLNLPQLLPVVERIHDTPLKLDTTTMGCPFQVKLLYRQPFMRSVASSVGDANPARWPLLKWLEDIRLNVPSHIQDAFFADTADITVPCLKIDLKPKEKSS